LGLAIVMSFPRFCLKAKSFFLILAYMAFASSTGLTSSSAMAF
jgi:hypothetical protein